MEAITPSTDASTEEVTTVNQGSSRGLSRSWQSARPFVFIFGLMALSFWFNTAVITYRMGEFQSALKRVSERYTSSKTLHMVARFELIRRRMDQPENEDLSLELRMQSLQAGLIDTAQVRILKWDEKIIRVLVGGVRFLLGKNQEGIAVPQAIQKDLEEGYIQEVARRYDKAIEVYTHSLNGNLDVKTSLLVLLHRGFCFSLLSEYDRARADFARVLNLAPDGEEGLTAKRFDELVLRIQNELAAARLKPSGPLDLGRRLFQFANYPAALEELGKALAKPDLTPDQRMEGRFFFARSQEELGLDSAALDIYRALVQESPNSSIGKKANRRLYLFGKLYQKNADLEADALKRMETYDDMGLLNQLRAATLERSPRPRPSSVGGVSAAIPSSGDLIQAPSNKKPSLEPEAKEAELVSIQLQKKPDLVAAPKPLPKRIKLDALRKDAISQTLSAGKGELQFLYQKWLRKGKVFDGDLAIRITISPAGEVVSAQVVPSKSTLTENAFIEDVLRTVRRWRFREDPKAGADVPVAFPLRFVNRE